MAKYKIKQKKVDAFIWAGVENEINSPNWAKQAVEDGIIEIKGKLTLKVPAGSKVINKGDYIIKDANDNIFSMSAAEFLSLYEDDV